MSTEYVILIHDDESAWERATPDERAATFARHETFGERAIAAGHSITGGGELRGAETARVVRPGRAAGSAATVTDGPFAEVVEQLGAYYVVATDDLDGLVQVISETFAGDTGAFEIRPVVPAEEQVADPEAATTGGSVTS